MRCKICGSYLNNRSRFRAADLLLLGLLLRPFRCLSCKHRFYRPIWSQTSIRPLPRVSIPVPREIEEPPDVPLDPDDRSDLMLNFEDNTDVVGLDFPEPEKRP
jgi:hypothetical protein